MTTPNPATNEKIAELRKLARAVAHPVWFFSPERHITRPDGSMCALQMHVGYGTQFDDSETFDLFESCDEANYRYIAAANPATVLALLDRLDAERARADNNYTAADKWEGIALEQQERANDAEIEIGQLRAALCAEQQADVGITARRRTG